MKHIAPEQIIPAPVSIVPPPFLYLHTLDGDCIGSSRHGGAWIGEALQRHFRVHEDEFENVETEEGEDVFLRGEKVAVLVWS